MASKKIFWKIDYYGKRRTTAGSENRKTQPIREVLPRC